MPVTAARCRQLALSLPDTVEAPHFDYASFRTAGRIFATMAPDDAHLHVFLPEEQRAPALALHPAAVAVLPWGKSVVGLRVTLAKATPALVESLLRQAWAVRAKKQKASRPSSDVQRPSSKPLATMDAPRRTMDAASGAVYFAGPAEFRAWLKKHHATAPELLVGLHKVDSGTPGMTWPQSVDEALCFGWIDGVRKRVDDTRYTIRFTPRRPGSHWSRVNIVRVGALQAEGRMQPAGLAAFAARDVGNSGLASYECNDDPEFPPPLLKVFRAERAAWAWFGKQPPGYRKQLTAWVANAKQEATQRRRLTTLIAACAAGERLR